MILANLGRAVLFLAALSLFMSLLTLVVDRLYVALEQDVGAPRQVLGVLWLLRYVFALASLSSVGVLVAAVVVQRER